MQEGLLGGLGCQSSSGKSKSREGEAKKEVVKGSFIDSRAVRTDEVKEGEIALRSLYLIETDFPRCFGV